ncbi:MAG: hypothetical protein IJ574_03230 [Bacilli bacterium]|nr:hypothetical protein [Bacilli bacterium]
MRYRLKNHTISRKEFYNLNEDNLIFITNPGRMGDEDGSTFIIKKGHSYIPYRVSGWVYYDKNKRNSSNYVSLDDMFNIFPKWKESLYNYYESEKCNGKYKYIYMGFGNGLCVDKTIFDKYYRYLIEEVKKVTKEIDKDNNYDFCLNYSCWEQALINMLLDDDINIGFEVYNSEVNNSNEIEIPSFLRNN